MKIVKPSAEIIGAANGADILKHLELCGRVCYKSEDRITEGSAEAFVANVLKRGHEAVLEHASLTARFVCDRGVSHELVRHRLASFCQESTRYCNYSQGKYGGEITVIKPLFLEEGTEPYELWKQACESAEKAYFDMLNYGLSAQQARDVLPNSLKTEVIMTANLREWRHFFKLRALGTTGAPHPQMREVAIPLLRKAQELLPAVFGDLEVPCEQ